MLGIIKDFIDLLTSESDPTTEPSPIVTPGIITELLPIFTYLLITTLLLKGFVNSEGTVGFVIN